MPVEPSTTPAAALPRPSLAVRLLGVAGYALAGIVILICAVLLAVRFLLLPRVDGWGPEIAARLSEVLALPVTIGALSTGWDGWNPRIVATDVAVLEHDGGRVVLRLPEIAATVSWWSLPLADLRLRELSIDRPELAITRLPDRRIKVAGLSIDPDAAGGDSRLGEWLLRQREVVVRDAIITWSDEFREAPQLLLDRVQFRLEHPLGSTRHRLGLTGVPPPELAAPIDLRAEIDGADATTWTWHSARIYLQLDFADLAAWSAWVPFPIAIEEGRGAARLWLEFRDRTLREMTADLELARVNTRLEADLPWLELDRVSGRVGWRNDGATQRMTTRDLSLVARGGAIVTPVDFTFEAAVGEQGSYRSGRASANALDLAPVAAIAAGLPMPASWRERLAAHAPRGVLRDLRYRWEGPAGAPVSYALSAEASDLASAPVGAQPGFAGLNAKIDADERGGQARLSSRAFALSTPLNLAQPVALDQLAGQLRWTREGDQLVVSVTELAFANADAAGSLSGQWRSAAQGPGTVDLKARLTRVEATVLPRYLPVWMDASVRDWVRLGILAGKSDDVRVALKGDLARFPWVEPRDGTLSVAAKFTGGILDYADGWPRLEGIDGEVRFDGPRVTADLARGHAFGAQLGRTKLTIDNLRAPSPRLAVEGEASGPTAEFLHFIASSPIHGWTGKATEGAQATGQGRLKLAFDMPLGDGPKPVVKGDYSFASNQLRLPGVPTLSSLDGKLEFTQDGVRARNVVAEIFGGPATFDIASTDAGMRANGAGSASVVALRSILPPLVADRVGGTTDWSIVLETRADGLHWTVDSSLRGASVDLPAPLGKTASAVQPLKVQRRPEGRAGNDTLVVDIAPVGRAIVHRRWEGGDLSVDRAVVLLGRAARENAPNDRPGVWIRGDLASFNLDDWLVFRAHAHARTAAAASPASGPALMGADLDATVLEAFGRKLNEAKVDARSAGEDWRIRLTSREMAGTATWQARATGATSGRVTARLARLSVPDAGELVPWTSGDPVAGQDPTSNAWPQLDVQSEKLLSKGRDLGRFELVARPAGSDWRIEKMVLSSVDGSLSADGLWRVVGRTQSTRLEVALDAPDAAAMLLRFGLPGDVKGAATRISGTVDWPGAPSDYDPSTLSGALRIDVGAGQFTKIEPGLGKLLGVLSLQALPRRITLDFRDVFSEGFAFDSIDGNVKIAKGVMSTQDLSIVGPAARVRITGEADLAKETQQLAVRVQPALSTMFSAGTMGAAMLLAAANPLVAAAVGAGTFLAQKVMKDPIEQMFSYEYSVTGSWSDPQVVRTGARAPAPAPGTQAAGAEATSGVPRAAGASSAPPGGGTK